MAYQQSSKRNRWSRRARLTAGVAIVGTGVLVVPTVEPSLRNVQVREIQLTDVDTAESQLGDGTALVFGGTLLPTPPEQYVNAADTLYLQPRGFTGTAESSYTPEGSSALDPNTLGYATSLGQDQQIMVSDIESQIAAEG